MSKRISLMGKGTIVAMLAFALLLLLVGTMFQERMGELLTAYTESQTRRQAETLAAQAAEAFGAEMKTLAYVAAKIESNPGEIDRLVPLLFNEQGVRQGLLAISGRPVYGNALSLHTYGGIKNAFRGRSAITFVQEQGLLFTYPIYHGKNVKYVLYRLYSPKAIADRFSIRCYDDIGKMLIATRDGEVVVPFAESSTEDTSFIQSEAVKGFYRSMHREMEVSVAAARTFRTERGETLLFEAEIPGTDYLLAGFVSKEKASEGIENITLLVVWVFGLLMLLVVIGSMYLVRVRLQVQESEELREAKAAAEKASQAKSDFLSNMSHEIRTPINAVLGMNEMILRESGEQKVIEYAENIRTAGHTLLGLINDILDFSKIEAGKMEIIPVDYDLSAIINNLVNMIQARMEKTGLQLKLYFVEKTPRRLNGDEVRIRQVITNLLTNAVKYTEKGSVTFRIGFERIPSDPKTVFLNISVSDTGIGIKPEDMTKLFSEFERIEEKRNRNIEGTGLGLNITKRLLEMMGSELKVESSYGKGSTFSFRLKQKVVSWEPLGDYEAAYRASLAERKQYQEKFTAPDALVLMVDDTPMNLTVFRNLLKQTKVQIDTAERGANGLELMKDKKYDLIFLDHMMPEKDGIETLHELKADTNNPNLHTPVVCLTANAISGARERYLAEGFDDYLTKPIDADELEEMMIRYLPKGKVLATGDDSTAVEEPSIEFPEWLCKIEEIDTGSGLKHCGGKEDYLETLKIYGSDAAANADRIENFWRARDLANTTIKVHALKSTSRAVGAESLGALAEKLELAGKAGDTATLDAELDGLLARYRSLGAALSPLYAPQGEAQGDLPLISDDKLREAYGAIREFAENFDAEGAECALNYLEGFRIPEGEQERVEQLRSAVRGFDWGRVKEILS